MVGKNNLDINEMIKPYLKYFQGEDINNIKVLDDIKEGTDREYLLKLEDRLSGDIYWVKSYQSRGEKILLPGISHLVNIGIIGVTDDGYIERNHNHPQLLDASLEGKLGKAKVAELIGNFYKDLHSLGITFGDRLEDHSFYDEKDGTLKISDFGTISSYLPAISLDNPFTNKSYDVNCYNIRLHPNAMPKDDIHDGLKFLWKIDAEDQFKKFEDCYVTETEDKEIFKKALKDFNKYIG